MSNTAVAVHNLSKIYRLYTKPLYRFLDMFGMLKTPGAYTEHAALNNLDFNVRRGEKVAIIGRNGAGKSTLLKLICGAVEPTSGYIDINGDIHALLEIGTGFHPDFTGRENVYSYLANIGLSGQKADEKVNEIIKFAELEEYIDQPIKTYSTGMRVRIMFATSTAISPDILVLDEVLGVGDGYFVQKSYERIRTLCEEKKTTLMLVTHDLYSAVKICERCVWIDNGRILMDMVTQSVIDRYESSIKEQEEKRLRKEHLKNLAQNGTSQKPFFGQLRCQGAVPINHDMPVSKIEFKKGHDTISYISLENDHSEDGILELFLKKGEHNWGKKTMVDGRSARSFVPEGSIFYRAPLLIKAKAVEKPMESDCVYVEVEYLDTSKIPCVFEMFSADSTLRFMGSLNNCGDGQWKTASVHLKKNESLDTIEKGTKRFGTQDFSIIDVDFLDESGESSFIFRFGGTMKIRCQYLIRRTSFKEKPIIQFVFIKDGTLHTHRFVLNNTEFSYNDSSEGHLEVEINPITFGPGDYLLNVVVMSEGGYEPEKQGKFFSVNENILDHHPRAYQIRVEKTNDILINTSVFSHKAKWKKNGKNVYDGIYGIE